MFGNVRFPKIRIGATTAFRQTADFGPQTDGVSPGLDLNRMTRRKRKTVASALKPHVFWASVQRDQDHNVHVC